MHYKRNIFSSPFRNRKECSLFFLFISWILLTGFVTSASAQDDSQRLELKYQNDLLTITAKNVDIKKIFSELAEKADIHIDYPENMEKNITLSKKNVQLNDFFSSFLRNMNYVLIFSDENEKNTKITELYVFPDSVVSNLSETTRKQLTNLIAAYKRAIERIEKKLEQIGENSSEREVYLRKISIYEKKIEEVEDRL